MNVQNTDFMGKPLYDILNRCEVVPSISRTQANKSEQQERSYAPIGVYDSGAGGLTILSALREMLPYEDFVYFGDTLHCPYGVRSEQDITELAIQACRFLLDHGVKLIVVACNTASQAALSVLRSTFPQVPFVGVVPAVKPAARLTQKGRIGVAATNRAVQASYLHQLIADFAAGVEVYAEGCPELVTLVERGELEGPEVEAVLHRTLEPLLQHDIDVLVLGCTHFPALKAAIQRVVGPEVRIIDSGAAIARRVHFILEQGGILHPINQAHTAHGALQIWSSGNAAAFTATASRVLGYPVTAYPET